MLRRPWARFTGLWTLIDRKGVKPYTMLGLLVLFAIYFIWRDVHPVQHIGDEPADSKRLPFGANVPINHPDAEVQNRIRPKVKLRRRGLKESLIKVSTPSDVIKTVLLWSTKFNHGLHWITKENSGCASEGYKCRYLVNKTRIGEADAVLVHMSGSYEDLESLAALGKEHRIRKQLWITYNKESPDFWLSLSTPFLVNKLKGLINYTANYSPDADILNVYGECRPIEDQSNLGPNNKYRDVSARKSKLAAWLVSHCHTLSQREQYVHELGSHISVDIRGACGPSGNGFLRCSGHDCRNDLANFLNQYKFYLAFENSFCEEYVTEKLFRVLLSHIMVVPVVMGYATYDEILPRHSYIDVRNFSSPAALGRYLTYLDEHDDEYNAYFDWRRDYTCNSVQMKCEICRAIHQVAGSTHVTGSLHTHLKERHCITPHQFYTSSAFRKTYDTSQNMTARFIT